MHGTPEDSTRDDIRSGSDAPNPPDGSPDGLAPELRLSAIEARVLGSLVEKQATTPDTYPLTANAVVLACNQKTSRDPVLELEPGAVAHALRALETRRLVVAEHGARAQRYGHRFAQAYSVTSQQQALLAMLLLRGAQTATELHARCERMAAFADADQVRDVLERLAQRTPALAVNAGRGGGQREDRYVHLLCGPVSAEEIAARRAATSADAAAPRASLEARVAALESTVAELRAAMSRSSPAD